MDQFLRFLPVAALAGFGLMKAYKGDIALAMLAFAAICLWLHLTDGKLPSVRKPSARHAAPAVTASQANAGKKFLSDLLSGFRKMAGTMLSGLLQIFSKQPFLIIGVVFLTIGAIEFRDAIGVVGAIELLHRAMAFVALGAFCLLIHFGGQKVVLKHMVDHPLGWIAVASLAGTTLSVIHHKWWWAVNLGVATIVATIFILGLQGLAGKFALKALRKLLGPLLGDHGHLVTCLSWAIVGIGLVATSFAISANELFLDIETETAAMWEAIAAPALAVGLVLIFVGFMLHVFVGIADAKKEAKKG